MCWVLTKNREAPSGPDQAHSMLRMFFTGITGMLVLQMGNKCSDWQAQRRAASLLFRCWQQCHGRSVVQSSTPHEPQRTLEYCAPDARWTTMSLNGEMQSSSEGTPLFQRTAPDFPLQISHGCPHHLFNFWHKYTSNALQCCMLEVYLLAIYVPLQ